MIPTPKSLILLDGGMGRDLKKRLPSFDPILWSASGLIHNPDAVVTTHQDYINAGAMVITTNNYTVVNHVLSQCQRENELNSLTSLAGQLAKTAVKKSGKPIQIAGCIPPLVVSYRPDIVLDHDAGVSQYTTIAQCLAPYVDLFLCESMSSIKEALMAVTALQAFNKPIWVSFILDDNSPQHLLSSDPVTSIPSALKPFNHNAVLFNCCLPETITEGLTQLKSTKLPQLIGGYSNAFKKLRDKEKHVHGKLRKENDISPEDYYTHASHWHEIGATIIGGCCGIGIEHINYIRNYLL